MGLHASVSPVVWTKETKFRQLYPSACKYDRQMDSCDDAELYTKTLEKSDIQDGG